MGDEQWKESSHGLAAKAWTLAEEAHEAYEDEERGVLCGVYGMQRANFLMLMAILKAIDEIGASNG